MELEEGIQGEVCMEMEEGTHGEVWMEMEEGNHGEVGMEMEDTNQLVGPKNLVELTQVLIMVFGGQGEVEWTYVELRIGMPANKNKCAHRAAVALQTFLPCFNIIDYLCDKFKMEFLPAIGPQ